MFLLNCVFEGRDFLLVRVFSFCILVFEEGWVVRGFSWVYRGGGVVNVVGFWF